MSVGRAQVEQAVREALARLVDCDPAAVGDAARLAEDLGASSLDVVELVLLVEDDLDITVPPGATADATTVGEVIDAVLRTAA